MGGSNDWPTLLFTVDPSTGARSSVPFERGDGLADVTRDGAQLAWDRQGKLWTVWCGRSRWPVEVIEVHTAQVSADGHLSGEMIAPVVPTNACSISLGIDGQGSMFVRHVDLDHGYPDKVLILAPHDGQLVAREPPVLYDEGGLKITTEGFSFDGGPLNSEGPSSWGGDYFVFSRLPKTMFGDVAFSPVRAGLLVEGVPGIPGTEVTWTPSGLFAASGDVFARYNGPPTKPVGDQVPRETQEMVDAVNEIRSHSGLPPLWASALITQAARNHSRYWTLNDPRGQGLAIHSETPGLPGFTGVTTEDRCATVGTACSGEIIGGDVEGYIPTAFHRAFLMSPAPSAIGGTEGGPGIGLGVIDAYQWGPGFLGRPFGYPVGDYQGELSFAGELPDPAQELCPGQISPPYGAAITVEAPSVNRAYPSGVGGIRNWIVNGPTGGVDGCFGGGVFVPDDPLVANSEYRVTIEWTDPAQPPFSWTFRTGGTQYSPTTKLKRSVPIVRSAKGKSRLKILVKPDLGPTSQWPFRVLRWGKHGTWKAVGKKSLWTAGPRHRRTTNLGHGLYRVRTESYKGYRGSTSKAVALKR